MGIKLQRLYLENYKLFDLKEICFDKLLTVFDGPNGYGKTSIFDAIELLITGTISRISENQSISGTLAYSTHFLSKTKEKDTILKGEFIDDNHSHNMIIGLKLPAVSGRARKSYNPKSMSDVIKSFVLPIYEAPIENWDQYLKTEEEMSRIRMDFFGKQNLESFTLFHYIRQEDRLSYLKCTESDRAKNIEKLFGIEKYSYRMSQIHTAQQQLYKRIGSNDEKIKRLTQATSVIPKQPDSHIPYTAIANEKPIWDQESLSFNGARSQQTYEIISQKLRGILQLYKYRNEFYLVRCIAKYLTIPEDLRLFSIINWKLLSEKQVTAESMQEKTVKKKLLDKSKQLIEEQKYNEIDWMTLCKHLGNNDLGSELSLLGKQLKTIIANQSDLQKSLSKLRQCRNKLRESSQNISFGTEGICPYCGHEWADHNDIEEHFAETGKLIDTILNRESQNYLSLVSRIDGICKEKCIPALNKALDSLENDVPFQIYSHFLEWNQYIGYARNCHSILTNLGIQPSDIRIETTVESTIDSLPPIDAHIVELQNSIPPEYYEENSQYRFDQLFTESFDKYSMLEQLSEQKILEKIQYIDHLYYSSYDNDREKLTQLESENDKLQKLNDQLKRYYQALKKSREAYCEIVIKEIEIPFFLYSSRLLQTYQAGQGILMNSDGKVVRFTAPGSEHDVLYTMSSGQLSAVLLAFSMALNKIYSGEFFQVLLIDDPIQCMDDINMISFVELLGTEFADRQIILSTHEDSFSSFIRYKFSKYKLPQQSIVLKES